MKKYELTSDTKVFDGVVLHRIKALISFGNIKIGALGGWIESEKNLSQDGDAWVGENAIVDRNAIVCENATVSGNAIVCGNAMVSGNAVVRGNAVVKDNARVDENAWVGENSIVCDNARVCENSIVSEDARVSGKAIVSGNAIVCENARVCGNADYIVFKNWWSSRRYFTWTRSNNKWKVGCFYGSGEELIAKAYKDSEKSGREYERVVKYVESILQEEENNK